jgi:hypothetical protein
MYTGTQVFKEINFHFTLNDNLLKMYPLASEEDKAKGLVWTRISEGGWAHSGNRNFLIDSDWLETSSVNQCRHLVLFPRSKTLHLNESLERVVLAGEIRRYFCFSGLRKWIDCIQLKSKALDYLFDIREATKERTREASNRIGIQLEPIIKNKQSFKFEGKTVHLEMITAVIASNKAGKPSIYPESHLQLKFEETDDYGFIDRLINLSEQVIQFCLYATRFKFDEITLRCSFLTVESNETKKPYADVGKAYDCKSNDSNITECLEKERFLPLGVIKNFEKNLFKSIVSKSISLDHIPESYELRSHYSKARIIVLAAVFEWMFKKNYPKGVSHSAQSTETVEDIRKELEKLAKDKNRNNKFRGEAKRLIGIVEDDSFSSKLHHFRKHEEQLFLALGTNLYEYHKKEFDHNSIAERIQKLRNNLAHGVHDLKFDEINLIDVLFLERIVLALQFIYLKVPKDQIIEMVNRIKSV